MFEVNIWGVINGIRSFVLAISESLRVELEASGAGVGVSAPCPGLINTKIMSSERNWPAYPVTSLPSPATT